MQEEKKEQVQNVNTPSIDNVSSLQNVRTSSEVLQDPYKEKIRRIAEVYQADTQKKLTCTIKGEQFTLEAVMYAFDRNETSSLKPGTLGAKANNPGNLHPTTNTNQYIKRDGKSKMGSSEIIRAYPDLNKGRYDLAYHLDYNYSCDLDFSAVKCYLLGCGATNSSQNNQRITTYLNNLYSYAKQF